MAKYHVIHGSVEVAGEGEEPADRKVYNVGDSFDMSDEDAAPLLAAGTIGKGAKLKDGESAPTTNPVENAASTDADLQRQKASEGAPEGSQDPKAAAKNFKSSGESPFGGKK